MASIERYTLRELKPLIQNGATFRLFKPLYMNGQVLFNIEKILTVKDVERLEGKIYAPIEVVRAVEHKSDDSSRSVIIDYCIKILKASKLFHYDESRHLDFTLRKETEKLFTGILSNSPHIAEKLEEILKFSKKLFIHSVDVAIIASVIELSLQQKTKKPNALRSEELLVGALLHDVGFLNLPKVLVEKRRVEYDENEKRYYQKYVEESCKIAKDLGENVREKSHLIIAQHQERLTGTGWPHKLKGKMIEPMAMIVGLADEFDLVMAKETVQAQNRSASEAMSRFSRYGSFIGHDIVDAFYNAFRYLR